MIPLCRSMVVVREDLIGVDKFGVFAVILVTSAGLKASVLSSVDRSSQGRASCSSTACNPSPSPLSGVPVPRPKTWSSLQNRIRAFPRGRLPRVSLLPKSNDTRTASRTGALAACWLVLGKLTATSRNCSLRRQGGPMPYRNQTHIYSIDLKRVAVLRPRSQVCAAQWTRNRTALRIQIRQYRASPIQRFRFVFTSHRPRPPPASLRPNRRPEYLGRESPPSRTPKAVLRIVGAGEYGDC